MILPQPAPLSHYQRYPLTWTLLTLNVLIYFIFFAGPPDLFRTQKLVQTEATLITGRLYHQFLKSLPLQEQKNRAPWARELQPEVEEHLEILGTYALRDEEFLQKAPTMEFSGDEVAIQKWREQLKSFKKFYEEDTIFNFGLNRSKLYSLTWLTYQFSHASLTHLFSNMMFLVVIGSAVELLAGSGALLWIYLLGGVAGGAAFLFYNGHGVIPMVGASAAISALLAFYMVAETRRRIRYVYFISPFPGHHGFIYLPTLLIWPLFLVVDFTNLLSTPEGVGGSVAYSAHVGGTLLGLIMGGMARWWLPPPPVQSPDEEYSQSHTLVP